MDVFDIVDGRWDDGETKGIALRGCFFGLWEFEGTNDGQGQNDKQGKNYVSPRINEFT